MRDAVKSKSREITKVYKKRFHTLFSAKCAQLKCVSSHASDTIKVFVEWAATTI